MPPEEKLKRFVVFGYDSYYPLGAANDERGSFDTLEEAHEFIKDNRDNEFYDILDLQEREWVE